MTLDPQAAHPRCVFVTGATGALGVRVVPALRRAGHQVVAMARTPAKAATLCHQGARPVTVSIDDRVGLTTALAGCDAVVNLATAVPPTSRALRVSAWAENERLRTEGSAAVVDAALAAGVGRLVQESVVMIYRDRGGAWIDEDDQVDDRPMAWGNLAAEASAHRFSDAGRTGTVLGFGWFYGSTSVQSRETVDRARQHIGPVLGKPDGYVSPIHLSDAATAVVAALAAPAGVFNVVDDVPLTKREHADALAAAVGARLWCRGPGRGALLLGDRLTSLTRSLRVDNQRFGSATGWAPRFPSARDGWVAAVEDIDHIDRGDDHD